MGGGVRHVWRVCDMPRWCCGGGEGAAGGGGGGVGVCGGVHGQEKEILKTLEFPGAPVVRIPSFHCKRPGWRIKI